jgi:phosphate transport system substrate-binding protein
MNLIIFVACSSENETRVESENHSDHSYEKLTGTIEIDGSSTVFPITQAVAEEFIALHPDMRMPVGVSGTGGGFKRFTVGETAISNASRPIKNKEDAAAKKNGISYTELTVAYDGISIIVNPDNDWVECLTVDQLNKIWNPDNPANNWNEVDSSFPDAKLSLYGPGTDSGTFDYFTSEINGDEGVSRADYVASEDDNVLVMGVNGDKNSLGYFGYSYYIENKDKLKIVKIDGGAGCVEPSMDTIADGSYAPLSRSVFIYLNNSEYDSKPELQAFIKFYLTEGYQYVSEVGYVPIGEDNYAKELSKME